jgi:hypothetical protein
MPVQKNDSFSNRLDEWLNKDKTQTLGELDKVFAEKSFAIAILLMMSVPALPLPTGGLVHVLEVIALIVAAQIFIGRESIWIPKRWRKLSVNGKLQKKGLTGLLKFVRFFERFSRPRMSGLITSKLGRLTFAIVVTIFILFATFAPPFSGLDTLPALGVVILCLSVILEDVFLSILGFLVGTGGIILIFAIGKAAYEGLKNLFF